MPRARNKRKSANPGTPVRGLSMPIPRLDVPSTSDEESTNDNISTISNASGCGSTIFDDTSYGDEVNSEDIHQLELFEEKLSEAIEGMSQKSAQGRVNSFESVISALSKKFVPEYIINRRVTIMDSIERSLKKGRSNEQAVAAQLAALLCIQLGTTDLIDEICCSLIPALIVIADDSSMPANVRAKCCWALGLLSFIGNYEGVGNVMNYFCRIFNSCNKNHCVTNNVNSADEAALHTAAISAWCLLLTVTSVQDNESVMCIDDIESLLDSSSLEIRLAAGEAVAVLLEQARHFEGYEEWELSDNLIEKLRQLATGSHKYCAKKDRKTQRSTFRDIIRYIEDGESPRMRIKFGQECLALDTWCRKKQYDAFCQALGSGMNLHLTENDLLRDILELGEKASQISLVASKQTKSERHSMNAAAFKARSISRGKNRDKRSVIASFL